MNCRYIFSDSSDPYRNIAIERCLTMEAESETIILYLWQNENTIVIGRNQDIYTECKVREFLQDGGRIVRRLSGGGAVYHDLGNLNFSLIGRQSVLKKDACRGLLTKALEFCGIETEFNGRNDLLTAGKKFSGSAAYVKDGVLCQHGTVLICTDIEKMGYYLTPDRDKLARSHVKSVSARVINLCEIQPDLTVDKMCRVLLRAAEAGSLLCRPSWESLKRYEDFFHNKNWIFEGKI